MTSKKAMLSRHPGVEPVWGLIALLVATLAACEMPLVEPEANPSPYHERRVWAVVPFEDEAGAAQAVNGSAFADRIARHLRNVEGLDALPTTRVIAAMQSLGLRGITSVHEAEQLIRLLKVDGLLVGSISAWDSYQPPKLGASVRLYARVESAKNANGRAPAGLDYRKLMRAATAHQVPGESHQPQFLAQVSGHWDGADGAVLNRLKAYANGRTPPDSPAGWRRYLLSMDLYSEFVAHDLVRRLFALEWDRIHSETSRPREAGNSP